MTHEALRLDQPVSARAAIEAHAGGRRLIIDWAATVCCGVRMGDLRLKWAKRSSPLDADLVPVEGLEPVVAFCRPELVSVLEAGRARLEVRGIGPFRRPTIVLENAAVWLDFLESPGALRTAGRRGR